MKINSNVNAMNISVDRFNKNADNISKGKDLAKNIIEENINAKTFEIQTKPIKTQDEMTKTLLDLKA